MSLTMTDMFCGAGGSSTGAAALPGITVKTAMNHWQKALDSHNANHPDTVHVQADIKETDPRYIATSDILWASPECTNHSVAKGRKRVTNQADLFGDTLPDEAADRSRATMWDVPRFAEVHRYRAVITENVVDAAKWVMFDAWLMAMKSLGYEHRIQYLNSMHAQHGGLPAPQSRDRMYVLFWLKGNKAPDVEKYFRPKAYCNGQMHPTSKAIPTITTHDRFAMITTLRGTNAPKDVGQPLDTFAANGMHHGLTEWKVPDIDDCEFRMLEPHEIKAGMAFPKEYIMLGNKREQVKMAGNAVTPPAARDLVACMAETLVAS